MSCLEGLYDVMEGTGPGAGNQFSEELGQDQYGRGQVPLPYLPACSTSPTPSWMLSSCFCLSPSLANLEASV